MTIGCVVDDEIHDDAQAELFRAVHELDVAAERSMLPVDAVIVRHVVAVVEKRRGIERLQPDARHAHAAQIVELAREAVEVADAVAVRVQIFLDVDAVDDRVLVPKVLKHGYDLSESFRASRYNLSAVALPSGSARAT